MNRKKVLITGIAGQDGALLAQSLLSKGVGVSGTFRRGSANNLWRLKELGIENKVSLHEYVIGSNALEFISIVNSGFDEIYHLAGDSFTADSFRHPLKTITTNLTGCLEVLETCRDYAPTTQIFLACSSEIFGKNLENDLVLDELSPRFPKNPYGVSQSAILDLGNLFRETYGLAISTGILFNHESHLRGTQFLTRKLSEGAAQLKLGAHDPIQLGNLDSRRDWGDASEFVELFQVLLSAKKPGNYIFSTQRLTSVREIVTATFLEAGYDPVFVGEGELEFCYDRKSNRRLLEVNPKFFRENETPPLIGSHMKLSNLIGRTPKGDILDLVKSMYRIDLDRLSNISPLTPK
jgi:GDPmannose 4,6-dehydratase